MIRRTILAVAIAAILTGPAPAQPKPVLNPAPDAKAWADIVRQPDLSGVWLPKPLAPVNGVYVPVDNLPTWTPAAAKRIDRMLADDKAGHPQNIFVDCLPEGMPSFILMSLNAVEFLATPGRITVLGEFDGNRLRRIWTDGRKHPADPDPTFHGDSIGHWEGGTLVVDTVGILPEALIAIGEAVGIPNNGDVHVVERIHLTTPDVLADDLTITAPHVFTAPWKTTRLYKRIRGPGADFEEGVCRQGDFTESKDAQGNAVFVLVNQKDGNLLPPSVH
jgi:hypothetical protein